MFIFLIKIILRCHPERSAAESKDLGEAGLTIQSAVNYINDNIILIILILFKTNSVIDPLREVLRLRCAPLRMTA